MSFSELAAGLIFCYTALETSIGAVSRLKTFSDKVQSEHQPGEEFEPSAEWRINNTSKCDCVTQVKLYIAMILGRHTDPVDSTALSSETDKAVLVLNNISLTIGAGEKIAVCGRAGR